LSNILQERKSGEKQSSDTRRFSPKTLGLAVGAVAIIGFVVLMAIGLLNKAPVTGRSGYTRVNKPAPDFSLPLLDGIELRLSDHLGHPVVINFWASWCLPCREESPALQRTWRSYESKDVLLVGVNIQDTESDARAYIEEFGLTFPNGMDRDGKITIEYGVIGLPVTFFLDGDGIVRRRWVGAISEAQLTAWVDELVAGLAPAGAAEGENLQGYSELD
jgi:cytochrome c biogenesis protein CcmG/thiol:disulfide interchange protein DsbE